jgi:hypothetical protein
MATMARAGGYNNLAKGNWAPAIYSQKVLKYFRRASVAEAITNTDYTGEIENFGDTVNILKEPTITVASYARGTTVNTQELTDDQIQLTIDQGNYFAFKVDDIEERQSHVNWEALSTSAGAYTLKKAYDYNVLKEINDSGATDTTNLGAAGSAISCNTGNECANYLSTASRILDEQDAPQENRWFVASPQFYEIMRLADAKLMDASVIGGSSVLTNGLITDKTVHGFKMYQSNVLQVGSAGTAASHTFGPSTTSGETDTLFGHMSAVATASHIAKTEVIRDPDSFADVVRGLHVFGRKVLRGSGTGYKGVFAGVVDLNT